MKSERRAKTASRKQTLSTAQKQHAIEEKKRVEISSKELMSLVDERCESIKAHHDEGRKTKGEIRGTRDERAEPKAIHAETFQHIDHRY